MSENPIQALFNISQKLSNAIQTHILNFASKSVPQKPTTKTNGTPLFSLSNANNDSTFSYQPKPIIKEKSVGPVTREEVGRCTWTLLHTMAAQFPENPTRQWRRDVKDFVTALSRVYPCKECSDHFKEILRAYPVQVGSHAEFSQWLCHVHNIVNRSLGKPIFPCERVDARWGKLECEQRACDLQGTIIHYGDH